MAVSADTVYQRVLTLLNKEQRGYMTDIEYNLLANQAQLYIFENYFHDLNRLERGEGNNYQYADPVETIKEKPSFRQAIKNRRCLVPANGFYEWTQEKYNKQPYFICLKFTLFIYS